VTILNFEPVSTADLDLIRSSGYFDSEWYQRRYPDVPLCGLDPAVHFLQYGWRIGRSPSAAFNAQAYMDQYPDVASSGSNPLLHYLRVGQSLGRQIYVVPEVVLMQEPPACRSQKRSALTVAEQLEEAQNLLEHYYIQCRILQANE